MPGDRPDVVAGDPGVAPWAVVPLLFIAAACLVAAGTGQADDPAATLVLAIVFVLAGVARAALWAYLAGRRRVELTAAAVVVVRGRRVRSIPWADVRELRFETGDRWPEWSRIAVFPAVVVCAAPRDEVTVRPVLRGRSVVAARATLARAAARHGVPFAG